MSSVVRSIPPTFSANIVHVVIDSTASLVLFRARFSPLLFVVCTVGILLGNLVEFFETVDGAFLVLIGTFLVKLEIDNRKKDENYCGQDNGKKER